MKHVQRNNLDFKQKMYQKYHFIRLLAITAAATALKHLFRIASANRFCLSSMSLYCVCNFFFLCVIPSYEIIFVFFFHSTPGRLH